MYRVDSENYVEEPEPEEIEIPIQRYSVSMIFSDVDDGIKIDGTVEFEMEITIPSDKDDLELLAEESAFWRIENSDTNFGKGSLPNLEIDTMDKIESYTHDINNDIPPYPRTRPRPANHPVDKTEE